MKVLFLFMSQGCASPGATKRVYPTNNCGQKYIETANEGYFEMFDALLQYNVIDDLKIFFESNVQPGIASWIKHPSAYCEVIPEIRFVEEYIDKDTIIFVRGGFKHWHNLLLKYKGKNWLILYAANTGRERLTWWDIIFDDIKCQNTLDQYERYWFPFIKPVNENIFYPEHRKGYLWDICIGASHIHDRKGQWRVANAISEYNKRYGELYAVMPGAPRRGLKTLEMIKNISNIKHIEMLGHITREQLRGVFNASKFFIHLGAHGQNDRGPIEALACGTPTIIASPGYHAPYFSNLKIDCDIDDPISVAKYLKVMLDNWDQSKKIFTHKFYKKENGFHSKVLPRIITLFSYLKHSKPTIESKEILLKIMEHSK